MNFYSLKRRNQMGKISKVYYQEMDDNVADIVKANECYNNFNITMLGDQWVDVYKNYIGYLIQEKNMAIHTILVRDGIDRWPKLNLTSFAVSGLKNKAVIIAEY